MTDTDPDTRRLTELLGSFDAGRVPDPDLDRVARRGARMRAARQLEAALAVLTVIAVAAGVVLFVTNSSGVRPSDAPAGPSRPASSVAPVAGTAADWRAALERSMPFADQVRYYSGSGKGGAFASTGGATGLADASSVHEVFRYTSGGRTTALIVTAWADSTTWDTAQAGCARLSTNCYPEQQTSAGPVVVHNATGHGIMEAFNRRPSGTLITVTSFPYDVTSDGTDSIGLPAGLAGVVDRLVDIAALVPEPVLARDATPIAGSSSATPTTGPPSSPVASSP